MEITELRRRIDGLDDQILDWLSRRAALALQIGEAKRLEGKPIRVPERETEVLERLSAQNPGPLTTEGVGRIFTRIIEEMRALEETAAG